MLDLIFKDRKEIDNKFRSNLFSEEEKKKITRAVFEYALNNNKELNTKYANPKLSDGELFAKCQKSIFEELNMVLYPTRPTTKPDTLTSILLERLYDHDIKSRELIAKQYLDQKRTEMISGQLLELYIQRESLDYSRDWFFSGKIIKDVDFIKKNESGWIALQIKNSDNTENNASSKVRNNTTIKKWVRRHSKKKDIFYWEKFPDKIFKEKLNEKTYRNFINNYYDRMIIKKVEI